MNDFRRNTPTYTVLIIGLAVGTRGQVVRAATNEGFRVDEADDMATAERFRGNDDIRLILADMEVIGESFPEFMTFCRGRFPEAEVILLADGARRAAASEAMRTGVLDFTVMPFSTGEIEVRLRKAAAWISLRDEAAGLRRQMAMDFGFDNFIGVSEAASAVRRRAAAAAEGQSPLAIVGEPGSGRELLARIIHHHGRRRAEPMRLCDGADGDVWERGNDEAGTVIVRNAEALSARDGRRFAALFNEPHPRRLILLGTPAILEAIGSERTVDAIVIPPLRSRPEDIPVLTGYFLRRIGDRAGRPGLTPTPEAMRRLVRHEWPGNVGELEHALSTAVSLAVGNTIEADHLIFVSGNAETAATVSDAPSPRSLEELERTQIVRSLEGNGWNFSQTAQQLGIGRTTLWRKIRKYHLRQTTAV